MAFRGTGMTAWKYGVKNSLKLLFILFLAFSVFLIIQNVLSGKKETQQKLALTAETVDFRLTISIIAFNRLLALKRLLTSLLLAHYDHRPVTLSLHVEAGAPAELVEYVRQFHWPYGTKQVHLRIVESGLVSAVVESWYPADENDYGLLLEDDIEVSPFFYLWIRHVISKIHQSEMQHRIYGISLYTPRVIETVKPYQQYRPDIELKQYEDKYAYLHSIPCSWGAVYFPKPWSTFVEYMRHRLQRNDSYLYVPFSRTNGWKQSWKKFLIELAWAQGWYMLYPNFYNQTSFSTNHLEPGVHIKDKDTAHQPRDYEVPLHKSSRLLERLRFDQNETFKGLPILDHRNVEHNLHPNQIMATKNTRRVMSKIDAPGAEAGLTSMQKAVSSQEAFLCSLQSKDVYNFFTKEQGITVLLSIVPNERSHSIQQSVQHYASQIIVTSILIVWNQALDSMPGSSYINGTLVRFLPNAFSSPNNRFYPSQHISTAAVLVVDDSILVDSRNLMLLHKAWEIHSKKIVGFLPEQYEQKNLTHVNVSKPLTVGQPIQLAKAMMLHKGYLREYNCGAGRVFHTRVNEAMNCEDLGMSFLVANATRQPPSVYVKPSGEIRESDIVFPDSPAHAKSHEQARVQCFKTFQSLTHLRSPLDSGLVYDALQLLST